jgi:chromosome partitioning protein
MRTIGICSQKGGCTKTTTVISLATVMAGQGLRVLALDGDAQSNLSYSLLGGKVPTSPTLCEVLAGTAYADEAVRPTRITGVDIIPAVPGLADVSVTIASEVGRERRLRAAMAEVDLEYDVCLVDSGPTRTLLTTNILNFVGEVLVPVGPGLYGYLGLDQLTEDMARTRKFLENKALTLNGVLLVLTEKTNMSRAFEAQMRQAYEGAVYATTIPKSVKVEEATARLQTIFECARFNPVALAYEKLTSEVLNRGREQETRGDDVAAEAGRNLRSHGAA